MKTPAHARWEHTGWFQRMAVQAVVAMGITTAFFAAIVSHARRSCGVQAAGVPQVKMIPHMHDLHGWAAAALTLPAFSCNDILRLRLIVVGRF